MKEPSLAYDLLKPDLDDDTRAAQIQQALEARDPASGALVAAALLDTGPDLAQALPPSAREPLIAALKVGMQQAAGPLAQIAPCYAAGLRDEQTDWAALQAALRPVVEQTIMRMQVGHKGQIRDVDMQAEGVGGRAKMEMTASDEGRHLGRPPGPHRRRCFCRGDPALLGLRRGGSPRADDVPAVRAGDRLARPLLPTARPKTV